MACNTCNGTGGVYIDHGWGVEVHPCPSTKCREERERNREIFLQQIDLKLQELARETA